jgi:hypothetical protein
MSNELIVIEPSMAVAVLSTDNGIKTLLDNVRANIDSMDGGSMKNKSSRAKIKSNAFKATKAFTKINDETIIPLIVSLTAKIQPELDIINAVKANQSVLKNGLQQIRKDVNAEVDAFEAELQRIEDEKAWVIMLDDAYKIDSEFNDWRANQKLMAHMDAININHEFDKQKAIDIEARRLLAEQEEKERIQYEKDIADAAAKKAREDAEREAQIIIMHVEAIAENSRLDSVKAKQYAENQRKAAIQADIDLQNEREQNRVDAENARIESKRLADEAKQLRISQEKERVRIDAEREQRRIKENADAAALAEKNRLAAIESTKISEAKKISDKKLADDQAAATRKANIEHVTKIKTEMKLSFIEYAGLSESDAINAVKAICKNAIKHASVTY